MQGQPAGPQESQNSDRSRCARLSEDASFGATQQGAPGRDQALTRRPVSRRHGEAPCPGPSELHVSTPPRPHHAGLRPQPCSLPSCGCHGECADPPGPAEASQGDSCDSVSGLGGGCAHAMGFLLSTVPPQHSQGPLEASQESTHTAPQPAEFLCSGPQETAGRKDRPCTPCRPQSLRNPARDWGDPQSPRRDCCTQSRRFPRFWMPRPHPPKGAGFSSCSALEATAPWSKTVSHSQLMEPRLASTPGCALHLEVRSLVPRAGRLGSEGHPGGPGPRHGTPRSAGPAACCAQAGALLLGGRGMGYSAGPWGWGRPLF